MSKFKDYQERLNLKLKVLEETAEDAKAKTSIFDVKQSNAYSQHVKSIEFVDSYRDFYKKLLNLNILMKKIQTLYHRFYQLN